MTSTAVATASAAAAIQAPPPSASTSPASQLSLNNGLTSLASNFQSFIGLLTTQLNHQDPLNPTDTTQFTQQITQMTGVEQQLLSNQLLQQLVTQQTGVIGAASLIGKVVTANGAKASDAPITGVVTAVQEQGGQVLLTIGANQAPLSSVTGVAANGANPLAALFGG
jgi:flagellar hook assembly protein FlgD